MCLAQVFVSPYGNGEWSYKDFEAIMSGCVVVKPQPGSYVGYPNIYQPGRLVVATKPDFSDLEDAVLDVLSDLNKWQSAVAAAQALLLKYADVQHYAQDLDWLLSNITLYGSPGVPTTDS
jgi:Glycosyl transferases group 1